MYYVFMSHSDYQPLTFLSLLSLLTSLPCNPIGHFTFLSFSLSLSFFFFYAATFLPDKGFSFCFLLFSSLPSPHHSLILLQPTLPLPPPFHLRHGDPSLSHSPLHTSLRSMGNTTTKEKSDHVDGGTLLPNGIYSGPQDYDFRIVQRLIHQRKLAPFYKGLEDWDDSEDALEERAAAAAASASTSVSATSKPTPQQQQQQKGAHAHSHSRSSSSQGHTRGNSSSHNNSQGYAERSMVADQEREMRRLYQGAIECPICFLVSSLFPFCFFFGF